MSVEYSVNGNELTIMIRSRFLDPSQYSSTIIVPDYNGSQFVYYTNHYNQNNLKMVLDSAEREENTYVTMVFEILNAFVSTNHTAISNAKTPGYNATAIIDNDHLVSFIKHVTPKSTMDSRKNKGADVFLKMFTNHKDIFALDNSHIVKAIIIASSPGAKKFSDLSVIPHIASCFMNEDLNDNTVSEQIDYLDGKTHRSPNSIMGRTVLLEVMMRYYGDISSSETIYDADVATFNKGFYTSGEYRNKAPLNSSYCKIPFTVFSFIAEKFSDLDSINVYIDMIPNEDFSSKDAIRFIEETTPADMEYVVTKKNRDYDSTRVAMMEKLLHSRNDFDFETYGFYVSAIATAPYNVLENVSNDFDEKFMSFYTNIRGFLKTNSLFGVAEDFRSAQFAMSLIYSNTNGEPENIARCVNMVLSVFDSKAFNIQRMKELLYYIGNIDLDTINVLTGENYTLNNDNHRKMGDRVIGEISIDKFSTPVVCYGASVKSKKFANIDDIVEFFLNDNPKNVVPYYRVANYERY